MRRSTLPTGSLQARREGLADPGLKCLDNSELLAPPSAVQPRQPRRYINAAAAARWPLRAPSKSRASDPPLTSTRLVGTRPIRQLAETDPGQFLKDATDEGINQDAARSVLGRVLMRTSEEA